MKPKQTFEEVMEISLEKIEKWFGTTAEVILGVVGESLKRRDPILS